jgi:hypothetical protein
MVKVGISVALAATGMKPEKTPGAAVPAGASEMGVQPLAKKPWTTEWFCNELDVCFHIEWLPWGRTGTGLDRLVRP